MSDQLSKVVREMRYSATNWKCGSGVSAVVAAEQAVEWADRLESATTPAEVEEDWQLIDGHRSPDGMTYTATYWCANTGALKTETTSDGRFRAGEGPRIRRPTLARQLAEQRDYADKAAQRVIASEIKQKAAESQLAEATRRLGEVEGLVGEWREAANGERDYYSDALRAAATQLESALTKEPTK